jgi:hypothetical protein
MRDCRVALPAQSKKQWPYGACTKLLGAGAQTGYQVRNEEGKCAARNKFCRADWVRHGGETAFIFGGKSFRKIFRSDLALVLTEVNKSEAGGGLKQRTIGH